MINLSEVIETNRMILEENLDVRTVTMGISLLDCADSSLEKTCLNIEKKITRLAGNLVKVGDDVGREFGVPVVNKRISVTPIALVGATCCRKKSDFVRIAKTLDRTARKLGVNFIGGYSAIVSKGMTSADATAADGTSFSRGVSNALKSSVGASAVNVSKSVMSYSSKI